MAVMGKIAIAEDQRLMWDSLMDYWHKAVEESKAMVGSDTDLADLADIALADARLKVEYYPPLALTPEETKQAYYIDTKTEVAKEYLSPHAIRELSYPTPLGVKPRPTMTATEASQWMREHGPITKLQATIAHKDEIIAGLQDEIDFLKAREAATELAEKRALFERDKAIEALRDICLERDKHKEDSELCGVGLSVLTEANKGLRARLNKPNEPDNSKGAQLAHAIGNAGESMSKQGLSLFDRYY